MAAGWPYYCWKQVTCSECGKEWLKREDSLAKWQGNCRHCAMKLMVAKPEMKAIRRENGRKVMARIGKLPRAKPERIPRGEKHYNWRGGATPEAMKIRNSIEMAQWRKSVFERDGFKCQVCGINDHKLHADHIKPFAAYPELRFDTDNGRTLCQPCHRQYGAITIRGIVVREAYLPANWRIG